MAAVQRMPMPAYKTFSEKVDYPSADGSLIEMEPRFVELKKSMIKEKDIPKVKKIYKQIVDDLAVEMARIKKLKENAVPTCQMSEIVANNGQLPKDAFEAARKAGCLIVRKVVSEEQALKWRSELKAYLDKHSPETKTNTAPYHWTKPQVESRSHPSVLLAMEAVNSLWHPSNDKILYDGSAQTVYCDRFRMRTPEMGEATLPPHLDSSSTERWEDPTYRACYAPLFEGDYENYDPWCVDHRLNATMNLYDGLRSQSVFRSLQGWLAVSQTNVGEGTLTLLPNIKLASAYIMLRPFFMNGVDEFDNNSSYFPGAVAGYGQVFPTPQNHPHLQIAETVVSIPSIAPGDFVAWHCDMCHAVDKRMKNLKNEESSVIYIAATPLCDLNIVSMIQNRDGFKNCTTAPIPDFANDETRLKKAGKPLEMEHDDNGAHIENILSKKGRQALALEPFDVNEPGLTEGARRIREMANKAAGFT